MDSDIIELGSSDEETRPPPAKTKKVNTKNAMVHIPTKLHEVTIKPVSVKPTELAKLGKNITITKTNNAGSLPSTKVKPPDKAIQKILAPKKKTAIKKNNRDVTKDKIFNPLSQFKKGIVQTVGNSIITTLKTPVQIKKSQLNRPQVKGLQLNRPQPLQKLPPSITIKKTATAMKPVPNVVVLPKPVPKAIPIAKLNKKRKIEALQTVDLDGEETASTSSNSPQWYVRPEEEKEKNNTIMQDSNTASQDKMTTSQQDANNKEPTKYIEITIEDSPIKPPKAKRTRELSTEQVITIDDSPNKGSVVSDDVAEGSDKEADTAKKQKRKVPGSKKKLCYPGLKRIEETQTLEIEFEPMEVDTPNVEENQESKIISLTPEIMAEEQASVEIAQTKEGDVSVVQIKPNQSKQDTSDLDDVAPKKVPAIKSEFHPIYQSFISLCIELENSNDMEKIIEKKIKTYYRQVPKEYTESDEFLDLVSSKIVAMKAAPEKMYLYIKDIVDELNLQRKVLKHILPQENRSADQDSFVYGKENELDPNKKRQIRKLEKTLKKLNRAIQKLENQEVDFDDEEDSVYLLTEKYKERMVRVHAKFCQLTSTKLPSQPRLVIDPRPGLSPAPAKRLEAWINKKDSVVFPDFHDVLRCVREANEENGLGWNDACIMEEARDLFMRCGRKIQRRRQENEWRLATSRITDLSDPAEQSEELKKRLEANRRLASTKESEVFDKYCDRQSMLKLEAEEIDDKDAEESPVESEEEDNDESSSLESKQRRKERLKRLLQEQSKKIPHNTPLPEQIENKEEIEIVIPSVETIDENKTKVNEAVKIQTPRGENDIGSDMDELHLLQKLHSDSEIHTVSTSESSGSETPIAISDTLDSSSDDEKRTKQQPSGIISIENSSYSDDSDDSDSQKNKKLKRNKKYTTANKELLEESNEKECASSSILKNSLTEDAEIENTVISSSDGESNADDNANSEVSENSSKVSSVKEAQDESNKDVDQESREEREEICIEINECDGEDDSINSEIIENEKFDIRSSSTSSGQYEDLLKEHNSDPLLKRPDLIPQDPTDKLFDNLVMKHFNDPLVKKHLPGSDSSNGEDAENSNSDTQSLNAPETVEEAKKDLIETSVDTEDLGHSNSPMNIVDRFIEKINKQSDGSPSSDEEKLLMKVDEELDLIIDIRSPVSCALEKEVNLARQTKAWPRFKDECSSLSSAEDDNTGDNSQSMPTKMNGSTNGDNESIEIEQDRNAIGTNSNGAWHFEKENESCEPKASSSKSTDNISKVTCDDMDVNSIVSNIESEVSSAAVGENFCELTNTEGNKISAEDTNSTQDVPEVINAKIGTAGDETEHPDNCSPKTPKEIKSDNVCSSVVSLDEKNEAQENSKLDANTSEPHNSKEPESNSEGKNTLIEMLSSNNELEEANEKESELISNSNLNINIDLLHSDANLSQNIDGGDQVLDVLNEKDGCGDEEVPRTIPSVCLHSAEGND